MIDRVPILFTIPNFITAGSGGAMLNLIERLDPKRFAPAVCVLRKGGRLDREVERLGIPFLEAPFALHARPYSTLLCRARQAAAPFRAYRPVLWHSFHYLDDYTEPLVARLAGARAWIYTKKNMNWYRRSWYLRSLLASRIAAQNTDMTRTFFRNPLFRRKTRLIPRGVDTKRFRPGLTAELELRQKLGIPRSAVVAGCVAHLVPVKGHVALIEAAARVPDLFLLIAGDPTDAEYAAALERKVADLQLEKRVFFVGRVLLVGAFLSEIDIFVLSTVTRGEGSPVALLEAMACGIACVASETPGCRDVIEHGKSGWLVAPEDPEALAAALKHLTREAGQREALGREARKRVVERYTIEKEVAAHEDLYSELLASARPARHAG